MFCTLCNKTAYVGKTGMTLYQRHVLNLSLIMRESNDPVAMHFYTNAQTIDDFCCYMYSKVYNDEIYREFNENLWKKKLNAHVPFGMNRREHHSV